MRDMKMKTKMIIGFAVPILLMIINVLLGNSTTKGALKAEDQERYLVNSTIFTIVLMVVCSVITIVMAVLLIKAIERAVIQLSDAAKRIAMGQVDIDLVKYNNDEFGDLVDEYNKVIDNIKYQAKIAEEVSNGNLTITVVPKSADDVLGNSLKKLVDDNLNALTNKIGRAHV